MCPSQTWHSLPVPGPRPSSSPQVPVLNPNPTPTPPQRNLHNPTRHAPNLSMNSYSPSCQSARLGNASHHRPAQTPVTDRRRPMPHVTRHANASSIALPACMRATRTSPCQRSTVNGHFLEAFSSLPHPAQASNFQVARPSPRTPPRSHASRMCITLGCNARTYVRTSTTRTRTYIASGLDRGVFSDDVMASLLRYRAVCCPTSKAEDGGRVQFERRGSLSGELRGLSNLFRQMDFPASLRAAR